MEYLQIQTIKNPFLIRFCCRELGEEFSCKRKNCGRQAEKQKQTDIGSLELETRETHATPA